jgi:hypothetical protein
MMLERSRSRVPRTLDRLDTHNARKEGCHTTTKKKPPKLRVAVKAPRKVADLLVFGQHVHDQMGANAVSLPSPNPSLATLQGQIVDLNTKEAATKTRTLGAVEDRDKAQHVLGVSLQQEAAYVEVLCNASPENAAALVKDAGFVLRGTTSHVKPPLAVKAAAVSGSVDLVAHVTKGGKANDWQYSLDGGKTWIGLPLTTKARTTLANLTPGTTVTVRQRALTKAGVGDWSQPVSHVVT